MSYDSVRSRAVKSRLWVPRATRAIHVYFARSRQRCLRRPCSSNPKHKTRTVKMVASEKDYYCCNTGRERSILAHLLCTYRANNHTRQRSLSHGLPKTAKHKPPPRAERRDTARAPRIQRLCACGLITSTSKISYTNTRLLTSPIEGHQECGQTTPRHNCENR